MISSKQSKAKVVGDPSDDDIRVESESPKKRGGV
jgi:hypothetical protein